MPRQSLSDDGTLEKVVKPSKFCCGCLLIPLEEEEEEEDPEGMNYPPCDARPRAHKPSPLPKMDSFFKEKSFLMAGA